MITPRLKPGTKFGDWTVLSGPFYKKTKSNTIHFYECGCRCGTIQRIPKHNLLSGRSKGCERCGALKRRKPNGKSKSRLYMIWYVKKRLGLLSPEWMEFENFKKDVGNLPKGSILHRLDLSLPFSKENYEISKSRVQVAPSKELSPSELARRTGYSRERIRQFLGISKQSKYNKPILVDLIKSCNNKKYVFKEEAVTFLINFRNS